MERSAAILCLFTARKTPREKSGEFRCIRAVVCNVVNCGNMDTPKVLPCPRGQGPWRPPRSADERRVRVEKIGLAGEFSVTEAIMRCLKKKVWASGASSGLLR